MKFIHISDSHGFHSQITIPEDIEMIIHSGDESNQHNQFFNEREFYDFIEWYGSLNIKYKIFIAGNHSSYIFHNNKQVIKICKEKNIIYLENELIEIEGIKIWGSPITPNFGSWFFMKDRSKMHDLWSQIPENIDILITHGPPYGILDLSYNRESKLEFCGCRSLKRHVLNRIKPKYMLFGHIHSNEDILNAGHMTLSGYNTIFSNGSVVTDNKFGTLSSQGNVFEI